jgi:RNA polymerase sigma factor (sigma-70 family)
LSQNTTYIEIKNPEDIIGPVGTPVVAAESLAERIQKGDSAAEDEFVAIYHRRVLLMVRVRLRNKETAEDVAQEAMLGALRGIRAGRLREESQLGSYVCGVARNLINNHFRGRGNLTPLELERDPVAAGAGPEELVRTHEDLELVRQAMDGISPMDRLILGLTLVEGMKPGEIAQRLKMKPELVRKRKSRAVKRIREVIGRTSRSRTGRNLLNEDGS